MSLARFPIQHRLVKRILSNPFLTALSLRSQVIRCDLTLWAFQDHFVGMRYIGIGIDQTVPEMMLIQSQDKGVL